MDALNKIYDTLEAGKEGLNEKDKAAIEKLQQDIRDMQAENSKPCLAIRLTKWIATAAALGAAGYGVYRLVKMATAAE